MNEVLISVAMTTYNGAKYLEEQLDSILRQTISNIEIVVCDDCSTDNTWDILQRYAQRDSRFRIYRNEQNLGVVRNFERAINMCSGDYIALSDQDDIWTDNHLEVLYENIGQKSMSCGDGLIVDKNNRSLNMTISYQQALDWIPQDDFIKAKTILFFRNPFFGSRMLFHKSLIKSALPIPDGCNYHDSWIAFVACLDNGINYADDIVIYYRRTGKNVTNVYNHRISRYQTLRYLLLPTDRILMIDEVLKRIETLSIAKKKKLQRYQSIMKELIEIDKMPKVKRHVGKMWYLLFFLLNHKSIYSSRF